MGLKSDVSKYLVEKLQFLSERLPKTVWIRINLSFLCFCKKSPFWIVNKSGKKGTFFLKMTNAHLIFGC